jgi:peptide/nickel transport system ATP-binding protein
MTLLSVQGLDVAIGAQALLADLRFEVAPGEVLGLIGESGSGKSLTALALAGLLPEGARATGSVVFEGEQLVGAADSALCRVRGRGIGIVFQEPATALNPLMTIGEQVAETARVHGGFSAAAARARAAETLGRVGLPPSAVGLERYPHELSGGQRQRVAIALAVALAPRLLIADEPTTALDVTTQAQILALLAELAARDGMALILISHDLAVVAGVAPRIAILQAGRIVEQGPTLGVLRAPAHAYTRALVRDFTPPPAAVRPASSAAPLLEADGVVRAYRAPRTSFFGRAPLRRAVDGVSLAVAPGERVGLVGESGSGKSTLVRALLGLETPEAGTIRIAGESLAGAAAGTARRLRRLVQVVFQDPYGSLNPRHRVGRIVAEPLQLLAEPLTAAERDRRVAAALSDVGLEAADARRRPHEFSGGQRQRIAIARALVVEPRLVILDEAVSALDASMRTQILELLLGLSAARGLAYLFVSHDLGVVRAVTDRTLVMHCGRIVEEGPTADVLERPRHPYTRQLVAATPSLERALAAPGPVRTPS